MFNNLYIFHLFKILFRHLNICFLMFNIIVLYIMIDLIFNVWILILKFMMFKAVSIKKLKCRREGEGKLSIGAGGANRKGYTIMILTTQ